MNTLGLFMDLLSTEMECPVSYSFFHISFVVFIAIITAILVIFFRNTSEKNYRIIVLVAWVIIAVLEVLKQILLNRDGGYQWYIFPFQFCSTPLYAFPLVALVKNGKFRDSMVAFTGLFVLVAGIAVFAYPDSVYTTLAFINHQTMIHHGSQVVIGIYTLVYYRKRLNFLYFLKSLIPFACFVTVALLLDIIIPAFIGYDVLFNMFFISPYQESSLPVLCDIYKTVPYIVFLITYLFAFSLGSAIVNAIAVIINNLITKKKVF